MLQHMSELLGYVFVFFFNKYIYLFLATLGLRCCTQAFSSCGERGLLFIAVAALVEHRLQERRLSSCGAQAQLLRGMWDLPGPGLELMSPALAGGFLTTVPLGKSLGYVLSNLIFTSILRGKYYYYQHCPAEEIEAQEGHKTWPRSHSQYMAKLGSLAPERVLLITSNQSPYLDPWGIRFSLFFMENNHYSITFIDQTLCQALTCMDSFNPHSSPRKQVLYLVPFSKESLRG